MKKRTDYVPLSLTVERRMKDELSELAEDTGRQVTSMCRLFLKLGVDAYRAKMANVPGEIVSDSEQQWRSAQ